MPLSKNFIFVLSLAGLLTITACEDQPEPGNSTENEQSQNEPQQPPDDPSLKTCTNSDDCADDEYCDNGCRKLLDLAQDCTKDAMCKSGHCASGVCCQTGCDGDKKSCRTASSSGYCVCRGHFSGDNCERCENTYFGDNCDKKIYCEHGVANDGPDGDGHCQSCNEGWSGKDCDLPKTCQNGTANVGLTGNGECSSCQSGWVGPNCDIPNNCLYGHIDGQDIKSDGSCACDEGYEGKNCEKQSATCILANANGVDPDTGICTDCKTPYYGDNCDKMAKCELSNTINVDRENGTCTCDDSHYGNTCENTIYCKLKNTKSKTYNPSTGYCYPSDCLFPYYGDSCNMNSGCNITGTESISANGSCNCNSIYTGATCSARITCNKTNMTTSGYIKSDGTCSACKAPYFGDNCDKDSKCNPSTTASVNKSTGSCTCKDSSYSGKYCHKYAGVYIILNDIEWQNSYANKTTTNSSYNSTTRKTYYQASDAASACDTRYWRLPTLDEVSALLSKYCSNPPLSFGSWAYGCRKDLEDLGFKFEKAGFLSSSKTLNYNNRYDYFWIAGSNYYLFLDSDSSTGGDAIIEPAAGEGDNYYNAFCVQNWN